MLYVPILEPLPLSISRHILLLIHLHIAACACCTLTWLLFIPQLSTFFLCILRRFLVLILLV